jgi:hypothetical protein
MTDVLEELRACARLDLPAELLLLAGTLREDEWDRLGDLLRSWPQGSRRRSDAPMPRTSGRW